ncbi:MAG: GDSL-type esterase/lipase family protein [Agathobacter sp.]|nr:GDSL-type esterase/lipase family protein [Agathobacter sp.]
MNAPKAPKDPEQRRPYFYIMKNKEIFGAKQEDGRGIQFLYQNDGRLRNSVQIVGNIENEEILALTDTVEGLKKLVHSIGVSVETDNPSEKVEFTFQMYGKKDIYNGGTNLTTTLSGDGAEKRIYFSDIEWREDDNIPGQIRIALDTPEKLAKANVRFYLNDGYEAPEITEELEVDLTSEDYRNMIKKSLVQSGNMHRLGKAIALAKNGEDITIAYIGGSITQGAGATPINSECYAYKSFSRLCNLTGNRKLHYVKAGVGGTPSELGMIRFERDVLMDSKEPDIVIVEFAVNDEGDETKGDCYESLVRKILKLKSNPAVILLFSVFSNDYNLQERLLPIGYHYNLPMISLKNAVTPQFYYKKNRVVTKNQYFYDIFHPTNLGHTIMADCIGNLFEIASNTDYEDIVDTTEQLMEKTPVIGNTFEDVRLLDKMNSYEKARIECGAFIETDNVLQCVERNMDLSFTPQFPYNWMYDGTKAQGKCFEMNITCKSLLLVFKDTGETDAAKAEVYVDDKWVRTADPFINGWVHCNPVIIHKGMETQEHHVRIQVAEGDENKKFTILGFGYVE